ncbi:hypothetical protein GQ55_7G023600 [Panicum hallii var. hallii]|uniref:Uncharacterized protein n=1 Tax=Panicum hallii var. hallii TaxID=1504633 RepID=A0A2T7CS28_9POAL|nr:hypothetical protein GQ55_7G023600 [Panicum hallii var. hallii]
MDIVTEFIGKHHCTSYKHKNYRSTSCTAFPTDHLKKKGT